MAGTIQETLVYWDYVAWYYINYRWHNSVLDEVIPYLRNQWFWVPLYFFLILYMPRTYKVKGWLWCLGFFLSFVIADRISAGVMKPHFHRLRPCHNEVLKGFIHLLVPCGGQYGFPSSHAANHFAISVFSAITLSRIIKWVWPVAILWALSVSYAQVYVGVHYPLDITVGALVGIASGNITGRLFNRFFRLPDDFTSTSISSVL